MSSTTQSKPAARKPVTPTLSTEGIDSISCYLAANMIGELSLVSQAGVIKAFGPIVAALSGGVVAGPVAKLVSETLEESLPGELFPVTELQDRAGNALGMIPAVISKFNRADLNAIRDTAHGQLQECVDFTTLPERAFRGGGLVKGKETFDLSMVQSGAVCDALATIAKFTREQNVQFEVAYGTVGVKTGGRKFGMLDHELSPIAAPEGATLSDHWKVTMKDSKLDYQISHYRQLTAATKKACRIAIADRIVSALQGGNMELAQSWIKRSPDMLALHAHFAANNLPILPEMVAALPKTLTANVPS